MNRYICTKRKGFTAIMIMSILIVIFIIIAFFHRETMSYMQVTLKIDDLNTCNALCKYLDTQNVDYTRSSETVLTMTKKVHEKIREIDLSNHNINNINGISLFSNLKKIDLSNNRISNIAELRHLKNLEVVNLSGNIISDISPLRDLTKCRELYLYRNKLFEDESGNVIYSKFLTRMENLEILDLSHNFIIFTEELGKIKSLKRLNLYDNSIRDLHGLGNLKGLEYLNLGENANSSNETIEGMEVLTNLSCLKEFDFSDNRIKDVCSYIQSLSNLKILNLQGNEINNISELASLTKCEVLILYNNEIENVEELKGLTALRELNLQNNNISDVNSLLKLTELHKLSIAENNVSRDNSDLLLLAKRFEEYGYELNYEFAFDNKSLPHINENGVAYVTYRDFGARCDGNYDDFIAIKLAHMFANSIGCEVWADEGAEYHIFKYYEDAVDITTDVDWKNATFIIHDENIDSLSGRWKNIFRVTNFEEPIIVQNLDWTIEKNQDKIPQITSLFSDKNVSNKYFVKCYNEYKKQYIRYGENANDGLMQQDYFLIDNEGNVLNDIQWNFDRITKLEIYAIGNKSQFIKGGCFISNNLESRCEAQHTRPDDSKLNYYSRNIYIHHAGNVTISGVKHRVVDDEISGSYFGFIYTDECSDIVISDIELVTRKYANRATYDLNIWSTVNAVIKDITSNDIEDIDRWGIIATYYSKDIYFNGCEVNRIDAHEGIYNLSVENCTVGYWGLSLTGAGLLKISDTEIISPTFITLRSDYGSTWDGKCYIKNSIFTPHSVTRMPRLFSMGFAFDDDGNIHDFGYKTKFPDVYIDGLVINFKNNFKFDSIAIIPNENENDIDLTEYWPSEVIANNVRFENYDVSKPPTLKIMYKDDENINGNFLIINMKGLPIGESLVGDLINKRCTIISLETKFEFSHKDYIPYNYYVTLRSSSGEVVGEYGENDSHCFGEEGKYNIDVTCYNEDVMTGMITFKVVVKE